MQSVNDSVDVIVEESALNEMVDVIEKESALNKMAEAKESALLRKLNGSTYTPLSELEEGKKYRVAEWKFITLNGKGQKVAISLHDGRTVILPERFNHLQTQEQLDEINSINAFNLQYNGLKDISGGRKYHDVLFSKS